MIRDSDYFLGYPVGAPSVMFCYAIWNKPFADILFRDNYLGFISRQNTFLFNNCIYAAYLTV